MTMIRSASLKKMRDILGRGTYVEIPPYQRSFSWTGDQAKDLFDDINHFVKEHPGDDLLGSVYFLGALVAVVEKDSTTLRLIDGQQRIASLTILLSCIRDRLEPIDSAEATSLQAQFIQERLRRGGRGHLKNRLTLNHDDKDFFSAFIQNFPRNKDARAQLSSTKKIQQVRSKFDGDACLGGQLKDKSDDEQKQYLLDLEDAITNCLTVVLVEADSEDGASDVFEVLNERGLGLSTVDLIRNFLLGKARNAEERDAIVLKWSVIIAISDNASKVQNFLRHYWIVRYGDVKARGLYRVMKDQLRKDFRNRSLTAVGFTDELCESAQVYQTLLDASTGSPQLNAALTTIAKLDATPAYPVLLATMEETNESDTLRMCDALISHYVRWTIIGRRESTVLETQLFGLAQAIHQGLSIDGALGQIRDFTLNDKDFEEAFLDAQLTKAGQRRPILDALERQLRAEADEDELRPDTALHVEHIYPQNPNKRSKLRNHDELINRIGNLTLLKGSKNSKIGNRDFKTVKKPEISKSQLQINKYVMNQESWGAAQIAERQKELASVAPRVWKLPASLGPGTSMAKTAAAKKTAAKKTAAKKSTSRKKATAKRAAAKKASAKKVVAKKTAS